MSEINDGGPAFPSEGEGHGNPHYHSPGMSLLDYFAGQALAGLLAADAKYNGKTDERERLAGDAYGHAYAMMNVRASLSKATAPKE